MPLQMVADDDTEEHVELRRLYSEKILPCLSDLPPFDSEYSDDAGEKITKMQDQRKYHEAERKIISALYHREPILGRSCSSLDFNNYCCRQWK